MFKTYSEEDVSRKGAKAQRKTLETRQRFASLRLCGRHLLPTPTLCKNMNTVYDQNQPVIMKVVSADHNY
jgi:hypothetical protein